MDISPKAIAYAGQLVHREGLAGKKPQLVANESRELRFEEFAGAMFDFFLAQSVFTHLKPEHIEQCFENVGHVMHENSTFFFTFNVGGEFKRTGLKDFCYPFSFFESLAEQYGFILQDCSKEYNHPRGQRMVRLMKKAMP